MVEKSIVQVAVNGLLIGGQFAEAVAVHTVDAGVKAVGLVGVVKEQHFLAKAEQAFL